MEMKSYQAYKEAYLKILDPRVKNLVKDLALEELDHKHILEKAYFEETVVLHQEGMAETPSMQFSLMLQEKPLGADADDQEVMIHAVHDKKRLVDLYQNEKKSSVKSCQGKGITICLQIEDIDVTHASMEASGLKPTTIKEIWKSRLFYIYDPEGNRIEFWS